MKSKPVKPVVAFLGDSLTAGLGLEPDQAYPAVIGRIAAERGKPIEVVNAGVSGDTTAGALRRLDWLFRRRIDILVVALGANDGLRGLPVEETRANIEKIVQRARRKSSKMTVVIVGMKMPANFGRDYTARFEALFPAAARATGAAFVPFLLEGVGGRKDLNQPDGIHPTARGQEIMAETVWKVLDPMLYGSPRE